MLRIFVTLLISIIISGCVNKSDEFYRNNHVKIDWSTPDLHNIISRHLECIDHHSPYWLYGNDDGFDEVKQQLCRERENSVIEIFTARLLCKQKNIIVVCDRIRNSLTPYDMPELNRNVKLVTELPIYQVEFLQNIVSPSYALAIIFFIVILIVGVAISIFFDTPISRSLTAIAFTLFAGAFIYLQLLPLASGSLWFDAFWNHMVWLQIVKIVIFCFILILVGGVIGNEWRIGHPAKTIKLVEFKQITFEIRLFLEALLKLPEHDRSYFIRSIDTIEMKEILNHFMLKKTEECEVVSDLHDESQFDQNQLSQKPLSNIIPVDLTVDKQIAVILKKYAPIS